MKWKTCVVVIGVQSYAHQRISSISTNRKKLGSASPAYKLQLVEMRKTQMWNHYRSTKWCRSSLNLFLNFLVTGKRSFFLQLTLDQILQNSFDIIMLLEIKLFGEIWFVVPQIQMNHKCRSMNICFPSQIFQKCRSRFQQHSYEWSKRGGSFSRHSFYISGSNRQYIRRCISGSINISMTGRPDSCRITASHFLKSLILYKADSSTRQSAYTLFYIKKN